MRKQLFFFGLFTLAACGQNTQQTSDTSALVSQQQANKAFAIVKGVDYLPFTYIVDGCYARSLYMSLELAAEGIPSSAHYVFGYLQPTQSVTWSYHVAPLLQVAKTSQEPWILDPAFESRPLTRTQWLAENFAESEDELAVTARSTWTQIRAGSAYFDESGRVSEYDTDESLAYTPVKASDGSIVSLKARPIDPSVLIPTFADMPTFLSTDIHSACTVMHTYIKNEDLDVAERAAKTKRLLASTTRLVKAMDDVNKLTRDGVTGSWTTAGSACKTAMEGFYR